MNKFSASLWHAYINHVSILNKQCLFGVYSVKSERLLFMFKPGD